MAINALWDKRDEQAVADEFSRIREGCVPPDTFEKKLERSLQDQTAHFEDGTTLFEPILVTPPKHDLVTLGGMGAITELLTGKRTQPFTHYAGGTGTKAESPSDTKLQNEHFRVSMLSDGYAEPAGSSVKFAGKFPVSAPTGIISEGGVFDAFVGGVMLFRTVFPDEQVVEHTQYRTFFTLSQTISLISIT